jgi:hypothetical protein
MNKLKWFAIMLIGIMGFFTIGQYHRDSVVYECKIEALKALQDPKVIEKLCEG